MNVISNVPSRPIAGYSSEQCGHASGSCNRAVGDGEKQFEQGCNEHSPRAVLRASRGAAQTGDEAQVHVFEKSGEAVPRFSSLFGQIQSRCNPDLSENQTSDANQWKDDMGEAAHGSTGLFDVLLQPPFIPTDSCSARSFGSHLATSENDRNCRASCFEQPIETWDGEATQLSRSFMQQSKAKMNGNRKLEPDSPRGVLIPFVSPTAARSTSRFEGRSTAVANFRLPDVRKREQIAVQAEQERQLSFYDTAFSEVETEISKIERQASTPGYPTDREFQAGDNFRQHNVSELVHISGNAFPNQASVDSPTKQIIDNIRQSLGHLYTAVPNDTGNFKTLHVKLQPEGLGEVELSFKFRGGKTHVHVSSSEATTRDILQLDASRLIDEIRKVSPSLELAGLSFSVKREDVESGKYEKLPSAGSTFNSQSGGAFGGGASGGNAGENAPGRFAAASSKKTNDPEMIENARPNVRLRSDHRNSGDSVYL
jgi:hypothetical protein